MTVSTREGEGEVRLIVGVSLQPVQGVMEPSVGKAGVGGVEEVVGREEGKKRCGW